MNRLLLSRSIKLEQFLTVAATRDGASVSAYRRPMGYQQILAATLASSTALTLPSVANSGYVVGYAVIICEGTAGTDGVRWRDDGTAPTSTVGMVLGAGVELDYSGDLTMIRFIVQARSPIFAISYYAYISTLY